MEQVSQIGTDGTTGEARYDGKHVATTDAIIGVFYDVYNELGFGFLESVYKEGCASL